MAITTYKAETELPIVNLDEHIAGGTMSEKGKKHSALLPDHVRCIVCGPSNCGKTNVMLNLVFGANGLRFRNVYVFSKSLYQPKYRLMAAVLAGISNIGYFPYTENEQVPHPNDVEPQSVMIFDDVACEKQDNIRNFFAMGRHRDVDTFYLCQTYGRIPKHLVRDNANLVMLFRQDETNLRHVYDDHINTDMPYARFRELCTSAWNRGPNVFVTVDKERDLNDGRYRIGLDEFAKVL